MDIYNIAVTQKENIESIEREFISLNTEMGSFWQGRAYKKYNNINEDIKSKILIVKSQINIFINVGRELKKLKEKDTELSKFGTDLSEEELIAKSLCESEKKKIEDNIINFLDSIFQYRYYHQNNIYFKNFSTYINNSNYEFDVRYTKPTVGEKYYTSKDNPYASANFNQCTCYAYGRFNEIADTVGTKKFSGANFGHATTFGNNALNEGFNVETVTSNTDFSNIKKGDLLVWGKTVNGAEDHGHVAVVESVDENTVSISNGNAMEFNMNYNNMDHLKRFSINNKGYYLKQIIHQTEG